MTVRITGIAGSLRRESFNRKLLHAAAHEMPHGAELTVWDGLGGVPLLSAYLSGHGSMINGNAFSWRATPGRPPGFQDHEDTRGRMRAGHCQRVAVAARRRCRGGHHGA